MYQDRAARGKKNDGDGQRWTTRRVRTPENCVVSEQAPAKRAPGRQDRPPPACQTGAPCGIGGHMDETDQAIETERVQIVAALRQLRTG